MAHQYLRHRMIRTIPSNLYSCEFGFLRQLYTSARGKRKPKIPPEKRRILEKAEVYSKLWVSGTNRANMSDVLNELKMQGKNFTKTDLISFVKVLRKHARYRNCFEILQWMEEHTDDFTDSDQALRLSILYNLKGIDEAEKYFASLPPDAKTSSTYGALLNCYCTEESIDKALAHFKEMEDLDFANTVAFNNLLGLYMKVGQPEKVPPLVQEMKLKNIEFTMHTYCVLTQSYGRLNDLEGIEGVVNEVELRYKRNGDWNVYSSLATAYIRVGQSEKAEAALKKLEEFLDNSKKADQVAYHHLITLGASLGNLEYVTRVWEKLKSRFRSCNNLSYLKMLRSLSRLGDIEGMKKCLEEWEFDQPSYDYRIPIALVDAYMERGMVEEAERLLKDTTEKAGARTWKSHVTMMNYYLKKRQIDSAQMHMELAHKGKWRHFRRRIKMFLDYFIKEKDVHGAEKFCCMLKKAKALDSEAYLGLLQTYAVTGTMAPEMRSRMEKDGVVIEPKHEELLRKISPSQVQKLTSAVLNRSFKAS